MMFFDFLLCAAIRCRAGGSDADFGKYRKGGTKAPPYEFLFRVIAGDGVPIYFLTNVIFFPLETTTPSSFNLLISLCIALRSILK